VQTGLSIPIALVDCGIHPDDRWYLNYCYSESCWGCRGNFVDEPEISLLILRVL
jgi:hypothetical protein